MSKTLEAAVERARIDSLKYWPGNARKRKGLEDLKESLESNGQFQLVLVQKSTRQIMAGNHTVKAAVELGWEEVDVRVLDVNDAAALKINLAANKLGEAGDWDQDLLLDQLEELRDLDELVGSGFTDDELDDMLVDLEEISEIAPPEPALGTPTASETGSGPSGDPDEVEDSYGAPTNSDRREKFDPNAERRNASRRLMVFDLPVDVFLWLSERLEELAEGRDLETNTEVVLELVAEATDTEAPRLTAEEAAGND